MWFSDRLKMVLLGKLNIFLSALLVSFFVRINGYSFLKPVMIGEGECIDDDWEIHPIGSTWYDNVNCEKLECVFHKNILYAKGYGCSAVGIPSGCELVPGKGAVYPSCCPQVKCPRGVI